MDLFEKQHRVDSVRGMIQARWVGIFVIVGLGIILKTEFFGGLWGNPFDFLEILALGFFVFFCNFLYWIVMRRTAEGISDKTINIISFCQVVLDQLAYTLIYYFTGTIETIAFLLYFITILIASSLYKTRGIILAGVLAVFLYSGATLLDYYKVIPHIYPFAGETGWYGNMFMTRVKIIGFAFYMAVAVIFSVFLSNLIRKREKSLREKSESLGEQTRALTLQAQELTRTKDWLHEALAKSDKTRIEIQKAKGELEEANRELKAKIEELEKYGKITVGREIKMSELKEQIKILEKRVKDTEEEKNNF
jgi:hypothetical protein